MRDSDSSLLHKLTANGLPRTSKVAPDSFVVFLTAASAPQTRLVVPAQADPSFSRAYYYHDSDGVRLYDTQHVTVTDAPGDTWTTVALDVSELAGGTSIDYIFEFALLTTGNNINTVVAIDDACTQG